MFPPNREASSLSRRQLGQFLGKRARAITFLQNIPPSRLVLGSEVNLEAPP